ncbi:minor tail protein [Arthrobacter phage Ottawa]|nr:minor tail protein [Arthrobacter phage Kharcho]WIC89276.1 minor tail protein [Arthrobacter phage Ottawa]
MALPIQRKNFATNPSFEASPGLVTWRTNLSPNPSFETDLTGTLTNYGTSGGGSVSRPTTGGATGGAHSRMTWSTASTAIGGYFENTMGALGVGTYTASAYVRVSTAAQRIQMNISASSGAYTVTSNTAVDLPVNGWTRVSATFNVTTAGTFVARAQAVSGGNGRVWSVGNTLDTDGWLVETGSTVGQFFDGSTVKDADTVYEWAGTTNKSISYERVYSISNGVWAGGLYRAYRSSIRARVGTYSMLVQGLATDGAGATYGGVTVSGLTVGATYTYSAYVWVEAGYGNAELQVSGIGATANTNGVTGQWVRLSQTFTAAATSHDFRVRNQLAGNSKFYVDQMLIEAGSTLDTYFDGNTEEAGWSHLWTGLADQSASTRDATGLWVDVDLTGTAHTVLTVLGLGMAQAVTKVVRSDGKNTWPVAGWLRRLTIDADTGMDWTPPLGRPITYTLFKDGIAIASRTVTVDADTGDLMDPLNPQGALKIRTTGGDPNALALGQQSVAQVRHENTSNDREFPLGARYAIARPGVRAAAQQVPFVLNAHSNETSDNLQSIVEQAPIMLIRPLPSWGALPPLIYTDAPVEENPFNRGRGGSFTQWTLEADAVAPVTRAVTAGRITNQEVKDNLAGRTHDSIKAASGTKRHVEIKANPLSLGQ